jgi:hypothetical protein
VQLRGPATLEPPTATEAVEGQPDIDSSLLAPTEPVVEEQPRYTAKRTVLTARTATAPAKEPASKWATTDYGYVVGELKRIFVTALIVIAFLIIVAILKH